MNRSIEEGREADALVFEDALRVCDAFGGVMISGDRQDLDALACDGGKEPIEQGHRFSGRRAFVIDVSGNDESRDFMLFCDADYLLERETLVFEHVEAVDYLAKMQIA